MKQIVLISHGEFARGLKETLEMFVGPREDIHVVMLEPDESTDTLRHKYNDLFSSFDKEDEVILACDILGGSPMSTALEVLEENALLQKALVFTGVNVPLMIQLAVSAESSERDELIAMVRNSGEFAPGYYDQNQSDTSAEEEI